MTRPLTVVTGGTRGIGAATARRLAADGHDLVISYATDRTAAEATAAGLRDAGAACELVRADVADPEQVDLLFDRAAALGQVTGLVNNAGVTLHVGDLADTPVEVVRRVVEVNLLGAILVARRRGAGHGRRRVGVVNVSSAAATLGSAHEYVHYAAAKAGVDALTVGPGPGGRRRGIRVNGVAPGIVRTGIHAAAGDADRLERVGSRVPLGRAGEPTEVAAAVAWLLGDDCPYATGATLRVAGGR